ncbi:hypothetical protein [Roseburia sp. 499]|uniref:hypothetical protein n=1 Tax=Roseburia sp. 499 TaxID=1261634 RepID=UPI000952AEB7|nr:hypothetical protein [Roseburia sp. 499]WVK69815.1 hypothetical protein BIV20_15985 [Roseburia sp. 499]
MKKRWRKLLISICILGVFLICFQTYREKAKENSYTEEEVSYLEDVRYYADALNMYIYRDASSGKVQAEFEKGGKEVLIETIERYNAVSDNKEHQVEAESLRDDYSKVLKGNEPSENLEWFAKWVNNYKYTD